MAVKSVEVSLKASLRGQNVSGKDFIDRLMITKNDHVLESVCDKGVSASSYITLELVELSSFSGAEEPSEIFFQEVAVGLRRVCTFLESRAPELFMEMRSSGLRIDLFVSLWINQDQMEFYIEPKLLFICGARGISIKLITNDD